MLARDWYYSDRRQVGLDFALAEEAASYDARQGDSEERARTRLAALGVQPDWTIADIGCGTGLLACEAAQIGARVHAIDISPAMLTLAERRADALGVSMTIQSAGFLSFTCEPNSLDLVVSEFALHHLPDFWKAVALSRIYAALKPGGLFFLRDVVFTCTPDGIERTVEQWADFIIKNRGFSRADVATHVRDEHSTFGWVIERMLTEAKFAPVSAEYDPPVYGTYRARKPLDDEAPN